MKVRVYHNIIMVNYINYQKPPYFAVGFFGTYCTKQVFLPTILKRLQIKMIGSIINLSKVIGGKKDVS